MVVAEPGWVKRAEVVLSHETGIRVSVCACA